MIILIEPVVGFTTHLREAVPELEVQHVLDLAAAERVLDDRVVELIVLGPNLPKDEAFELAHKLHEQHPTMGLVLATATVEQDLYREAMRAGFSDVLPATTHLDEIRDVLERGTAETRRLRGADQQEGRQQLATTVATFSTKGGCGKSFIATNIATLLADRYPGEVVLVDLDLQAGDVAIMLQLMPKYGLQEVAELGDDLDEQVLAGLLTPAGSLKVLAAPDHPVHAELVTPETVTRVLNLLETMFRWVVIDGPPHFSEQMLAAVEHVDTIMVVSSLDVPSIKNLRLSVDTLKELGVPRDRMRLVLNRADSKVGLTVREVEKSLGTTIDVAIPSSREVPYAVNQGVAIVSARPKAPVSKALNQALRNLQASAAARTETEPAATSDTRRSRARRKR